MTLNVVQNIAARTWPDCHFMVVDEPDTMCLRVTVTHEGHVAKRCIDYGEDVSPVIWGAVAEVRGLHETPAHWMAL